MYVGVRVKCLMFLSDFHKTVIFFPDFTRNPQYKVSRKSVQGESKMGTYRPCRNVGKQLRAYAA